MWTVFESPSCSALQVHFQPGQLSQLLTHQNLSMAVGKQWLSHSPLHVPPCPPVSLASYLGPPHHPMIQNLEGVTLVLWGTQDLIQALRPRSVPKRWFPELLGLKISGNALPTCWLLGEKLQERADTCFLLFSAGLSCCGPQMPHLAWVLIPALGAGF